MGGLLGSASGYTGLLFSRRHLRDTGSALMSVGAEKVWTCAGEVRELGLMSFDPMTGSYLLRTYDVYWTCIVPGTRGNSHRRYADGNRSLEE